MSLLKRVVDSCMQKVSGIEDHCDRCLRTEEIFTEIFKYSFKDLTSY